MAVTTTYEFIVGDTFDDDGVTDELDVSSVAAGYVYGGYSTGFNTSAATYETGLPSNFGYFTGREIALAGLKGSNSANYVAVTQDADSIIYQIMGVNGVPVTGVLDTNDSSTTFADVAALANGGFVIASQDSFGGTDYDIDFRVFNAAGVQQGSFTVDGSLADDRDVSVAVLDNGNIALAWTRTIASETEIWTAVYTTAGVAVKAATLVDTTGTQNFDAEVVAVDGGYLIGYSDNDNFWGDTKINVQKLDSAGNTVGGPAGFDDGLFAAGEVSLTRLDSGLVALAFSRISRDDIYLALLDPSTMTGLAQLEYDVSFNLDTNNPEVAAYGTNADRLVLVADKTYDSNIGPTDRTQISEISAYRRMQGDGAGDKITADNTMSHHLLGEGGNDKLYGGSKDDLLEGGIGNDTLDGKGGGDEMIGGAGNDSYFVDSYDDVVTEAVNGGTDKITTGLFSFELAENVENLTMTGGATYGYGNALNNTMTGNAGDNTLYGYGGKDKLDGKAGADYMDGGDGSDTYYVDNAGDVVVETNANAATGGKDAVNVSYAGANYTLGANIENGNLTGSGYQILSGNDLANSLTSKGNANNLATPHFLYGLGGKDTLKGGTGYEILNGGTGADTLTGGGGFDQFEFSDVETSANKDTIKDFSHPDDEINFHSSAFIALASLAGTRLSDGPAGLDAFFLGTAAGDAEDRIIYDQGSGNLWYDSDGTGAALQILVAVLTGSPDNVDASDFFIF